jgi:hypothetical protein
MTNRRRLAGNGENVRINNFIMSFTTIWPACVILEILYDHLQYKLKSLSLTVWEFMTLRWGYFKARVHKRVGQFILPQNHSKLPSKISTTVSTVYLVYRLIL